MTLLAEEPGGLLGRDDRDVIITPHPGEMARLAGMTTDEVQANRLQVASDFATTHHVYVVMKGHRTVIATPTGRVFINPTGNPGMATAGTGDVLTGMVAAWLAQLLDAEAACRISVFLHGAAGNRAEAECGQIAMTSTDATCSRFACTSSIVAPISRAISPGCGVMITSRSSLPISRPGSSASTVIASASSTSGTVARSRSARTNADASGSVQAGPAGNHVVCELEHALDGGRGDTALGLGSGSVMHLRRHRRDDRQTAAGVATVTRPAPDRSAAIAGQVARRPSSRASPR